VKIIITEPAAALGRRTGDAGERAISWDFVYFDLSAASSTLLRTGFVQDKF